jgi:hypothetical protein
MVCIICKEEIKEGTNFISIGKGLYRHKFCHPGLPKNLDGTILILKTIPEEIIVIDKSKKRGRGRPKGSKNKEK